MSKYKINQGDIIRIGRITTRIKTIFFSGSSNHSKIIENKNLIEIQEIKNKSNNNTVTDSTNSKTNSKKTSKKNSNNKNKICRICYMEEEDSEENPLVQPCICSGSMKYIHLKCLKHWINTRSFDKVESNDLCSIYIIKPVECELCKTKFPDFIRHNGKLFALLDYNYEYKNYLTLESLTLDKHKHKFLYVISLDNNKKIKLGRGHDSDILLSDISVSRIHCIISTENKNVYIEDNNSKFGTLILIQSPSIQMVEHLPLFFQVGRTFFSCRFKKQAKLFQCCGVSERPNLFYYHKQNIMQVNSKTTWTVKTDVDFDDNDFLPEVEDNNNFNKDNEDNKIIDLIDDENNEINNKANLNKDSNKGTMLFDKIEIDFNGNKIVKENILTDQNKENINIENIIINNNSQNNKNKEKIDKTKIGKKEKDNKSESIIIEDENIDEIEKKGDLITNEVN